MDEHEPVKRPGWPEKQFTWLDERPDWIRYVLIIALVVAVTLALYFFDTRQVGQIFHGMSNNL